MMRSLEFLKKEFERLKPLEGKGVLLHMHLTPQTITLGETLHFAGADIVYLPSNRNPSSPGVIIKAKKNGIVLQSLAQLDNIAGEFQKPNQVYYVIEGNGRIFHALHQEIQHSRFFAAIAGISEHTSGGGRIVNSFDPKNFLVPVVAVYKNPLKTLLETGLGTSQTVTAALLRGLNQPVSGRNIVIVGFGNVGQGVARTVRTLGAKVTVVDIKNEVCLLAQLQGFRWTGLKDALKTADICITTTGLPSVINVDLIEKAKEGVVFTNVSNEPSEIDLKGCQPLETISSNLVSWKSPGGRLFFLLGGGLQVNHVVEKGNPAELMDLSFSLHALILKWLVETGPPSGLYEVPPEIKERVAELVMVS